MSESYPLYIDRRDEEVIKQLEEGAVYGVRHITKLYKRRTDISRDSTAKERKKNLVESPAFEYVSIATYRYVGVDGE